MRRCSLFYMSAIFNGTNSVVTGKFVGVSVSPSRKICGFRISAIVTFARLHAFFRATRLANGNPLSPGMFGGSLFNASAVCTCSVVASEFVRELMLRCSLFNASAIHTGSVVASEFIRKLMRRSSLFDMPAPLYGTRSVVTGIRIGILVFVSAFAAIKLATGNYAHRYRCNNDRNQKNYNLFHLFFLSF